MKKRKESRAKLEKALDQAWSEYVRRRDKICQKCGGNSPISAHHAFGRRHRQTRWDIYNGVGLDYACHVHWAHRDPGGFTEWFKRHIGNDQYERLAEAHAEIAKHTTEELERMLKDIKAITSELD